MTAYRTSTPNRGTRYVRDDAGAWFLDPEDGRDPFLLDAATGIFSPASLDSAVASGGLIPEGDPVTPDLEGLADQARAMTEAGASDDAVFAMFESAGVCLIDGSPVDADGMCLLSHPPADRAQFLAGVAGEAAAACGPGESALLMVTHSEGPSFCVASEQTTPSAAASVAGEPDPDVIAVVVVGRDGHLTSYPPEVTG